MTDGEALLAAVRADPEDDTARLVFADWMEEHGAADTAAYIRSEIAAYRAGRTEIQWDRVGMWGSVRGLPHVLRVSNHVWLESAARFLDLADWVGREVWLTTPPMTRLSGECPDRGYVWYFVAGVGPANDLQFQENGFDTLSARFAAGLAAYAKEWPGVTFKIENSPGPPIPRTRPVALMLEQITGRPVAD